MNGYPSPARAAACRPESRCFIYANATIALTKIDMVAKIPQLGVQPIAATGNRRNKVTRQMPFPILLSPLGRSRQAEWRQFSTMIFPISQASS
jgi:hypothetical protein